MRYNSYALTEKEVLYHKIFPYYIPASCNLCDFPEKITHIHVQQYKKENGGGKIIAFPVLFYNRIP